MGIKHNQNITLKKTKIVPWKQEENKTKVKPIKNTIPNPVELDWKMLKESDKTTLGEEEWHPLLQKFYIKMKVMQAKDAKKYFTLTGTKWDFIESYGKSFRSDDNKLYTVTITGNDRRDSYELKINKKGKNNRLLQSIDVFPLPNHTTKEIYNYTGGEGEELTLKLIGLLERYFNKKK